MRKPMLKMALLIAFVLFTALSCDIFINTGTDTSDLIRDKWLLIFYGGASYGSANVVYDISRSTIVETAFGFYQGTTAYTIDDDVISLVAPAAVGLIYLPSPAMNTYTVRLDGDSMIWDAPGRRSYFVFQKY